MAYLLNVFLWLGSYTRVLEPSPTSGSLLSGESGSPPLSLCQVIKIKYFLKIITNEMQISCKIIQTIEKSHLILYR